MCTRRMERWAVEATPETPGAAVLPIQPATVLRWHREGTAVIGDDGPVGSAVDPEFLGTTSASPDGRWLAYGSRETGTWEVYVRPFPDVNAGKWQVSAGGGVQPVWGRSAPELFYLTPDAEVVAARYEGSSGFRVTDRTTLFAAPTDATGLTSAYFGKYDVSPDDQRFLMARTPPGTEDEQQEDAWVLVQNVVEEIRRLVGPGGGL